jgi:hypothetical protein
MITDEIQKTTQSLEERGIPNDSFWTAIFEDDSEITEKETNWSFFSDKKIVEYLDKKKMVNISKFPVKKLTCILEGLKAEIDVPEGCQVYQAVRSEAIIVPNFQRKDRIIGRIIGIVKNDKIIEELYINALTLKIEGFKV